MSEAQLDSANELSNNSILNKKKKGHQNKCNIDIVVSLFCQTADTRSYNGFACEIIAHHNRNSNILFKDSTREGSPIGFGIPNHLRNYLSNISNDTDSSCIHFLLAASNRLKKNQVFPFFFKFLYGLYIFPFFRT